MDNQTETTGWHFTNSRYLRDGRPLPAAGEWLTHDGPRVLCQSGLHYSPTIWTALQHAGGALREVKTYASGIVLHRVTCRDVAETEDTKGVCHQRRIDASADMVWPLVQFAEWCAVRAAANSRAYGAYARAYAAANARAYAAANARAYAAEAAASAAGRLLPAGNYWWQSTADSASAAAATAYAAADSAYASASEREWQESTLRLLFDALTDRHPEMMQEARR